MNITRSSETASLFTFVPRPQDHVASMRSTEFGHSTSVCSYALFATLAEFVKFRLEDEKILSLWSAHSRTYAQNSKENKRHAKADSRVSTRRSGPDRRPLSEYEG